jgi:hypothetical protein
MTHLSFSLCPLCVLYVSVVNDYEQHSPQRHREHRGGTESFVELESAIKAKAAP